MTDQPEHARTSPHHLEAKSWESPAEVAERLGISTKTVRRLITEGRLRAYRIGPKLLRLDPAEVDAMVAERTS